MLWGALSAHANEQAAAKWTAKKRPLQLFFVMRVAQALAWIEALLAGALKGAGKNSLLVQRWTPCIRRSPQNSFAIRTDASPWGFGGDFV